MSRLFRKEALEHQEARRFGSGIALSPLSFKLVTVFVLIIVVAIGCFLYWGSYSNKKTVAGYVLPSKGVVTVHAPQRGTIVARYVDLGDHVRQGQKLYQIELERSTLKTADVNAALLAQYGAQVKSIQNQMELAKRLKASKVAQLQSQQRDLKVEYGHLGGQLKTEKAILALARKNLSRYQQLARTGMVSKSDLQKARQKALAQQATNQELEKNRIALHTQIDQIPAEISQAQTNTANQIADLENQSSQIDQQRLQLQVAQKVVVRAPTDGVVSSVITRLGQGVSAQTPLMSILPHGSVFQARLLVPTRAIGFVHTGEPVRLRYSAFPYQQFGLYRGRVNKVSRSIIAPLELHLPVTSKTPYYLVTASLAKPYVRAYGKRMPLTAGMTLSADIVLNRERLYEWILRPIESLRGHL
jgi:membrane fusion protein